MNAISAGTTHLDAACSSGPSGSSGRRARVERPRAYRKRAGHDGAARADRRPLATDAGAAV